MGNKQSSDLNTIKIRSETPGCKNVIHFNNAGAALPARNVLGATIKYLKKEAYEGFQPLHYKYFINNDIIVIIGGYEVQKSLSDDLNIPYIALAKILNCSPNEIAIVQNATDAWQKVFFSFKFKDEDRIISTPIEYGSNYINFLQVS